jgi:hypothetical protein
MRYCAVVAVVVAAQCSTGKVRVFPDRSQCAARTAEALPSLAQKPTFVPSQMRLERSYTQAFALISVALAF